MSQLSQTKITTIDPSFTSKQKLLSERIPLEEPTHEVMKSEKKCITATKSELRSNQKFKERMVTSREASAEKYRENSERFPSAFKVGGKSTKKNDVVSEVIEERTEKKDKADKEDNKENVPSNTNSKVKGITMGTASKLFNKGLEIGMTGSKLANSNVKVTESNYKVNQEGKSASNSKEAQETNQDRIDEEVSKLSEDSLVDAN
jgi:hypothetical protein